MDQTRYFVRSENTTGSLPLLLGQINHADYGVPRKLHPRGATTTSSRPNPIDSPTDTSFALRHLNNEMKCADNLSFECTTTTVEGETGQTCGRVAASRSHTNHGVQSWPTRTDTSDQSIHPSIRH